MQFVTNINPIELDRFVKDHPYGHYMKTSFWAEYKKITEGYQPIYVGIKDSDTLVATAVILKKRSWFSIKPYLYIPTGMCVDYHNKQYLDYFVDCLKDFAKAQGVSFLRIDPNVLRCHRTIQGDRLDDGFSNEWLTDHLIAQGFNHKGYGYAYNGSWINRYTLMIDLTLPIDDIIAKFNKSKQNVLKRHELMGVKTRLGLYDELNYLVDFEWELTKTQGFKPHDLAFFQTLSKTLNDHAYYYVTEVDLERQITNLNSEINSNKYRKDKEALQAKILELEKAVQLKNTYGNKVVIAAGLFVVYGKRSWDLYTYNRKEFSNYKATDNLHTFVINDMKNKQVELYDMVGFSGVTKKDDPYYGLYDYKRSFGSDFYEHIGEFDLVINPRAYRNFKYLLNQIKRIRRKWFRIRYKKD